MNEKIVLTGKTLEEKFNEYVGYSLRQGTYKQDENLRNVLSVFSTNVSGLLLMGNVGSGKTFIFDVLNRITHPDSKRFFIKVNCIQYVNDFNQFGYEVLSRYRDKNILFDELGEETKAQYYSRDSFEALEKVIQLRYELFRKKGLKTHFTTNLTNDEILKRYGQRCTSRLSEMCTRILLGDKVNSFDKRQYKNFIDLPLVAHKPRLI
jgi:DNA replication protein DnaC